MIVERSERRASGHSSSVWRSAPGRALLLAPQSGEETRREIARRARRAQEAAQDLVEDLSGTVADKFQDVRASVEERIEATLEAVDAKKRQVSNAFEAGRAAAREARGELEHRIAESKSGVQRELVPQRGLPARLGWLLRDYAKRVWDNSGEDNVFFLAGGIRLQYPARRRPVLSAAGDGSRLPPQPVARYDVGGSASIVDKFLPPHPPGDSGPAADYPE